MALQSGDCLVGRIGLSRECFTPTCIVKRYAQLGITQPSLVRTYIFNSILFPETIRVSEGAKAALSGHTGTGEYYNVHNDRLILASLAT